MFYAYTIKSLKNNKRYTGHTSKSPAYRLEEHNRGCNKWARENKPFRLIYFETYTTKTEAIRREKFLKSGQGRKYLDSILMK